jgi:hypothetical protein
MLICLDAAHAFCSLLCCVAKNPAGDLALSRRIFPVPQSTLESLKQD